MTERTLKSPPAYFDAVKRGVTAFRTLKDDDRGFQIGDILILQRTRADMVGEVDIDPITGKANHEIKVRVVGLFVGVGQGGLPPGYVCISVEMENGHD